MRWLVANAVLVMFLGCGPAAVQYPAARLAGSVTISGAPIDTGRIHFMPNTGTPGVPVTAEISGGRYEAENVPLGNVTVTFSAAKETGNMIREVDREPYPETVSIIPTKYSQGLPLTVAGDNDAQNFDLTSDAG